MAFMEKTNWVILVVGISTLAVYLGVVLPQALTRSIADVSYVQPMVYAIVAFIVLCIVGMIVAAASNPKEADKQDQRDKEIDQVGERIGNSFIAVAFGGALILTLVEADYFWIANALYLGGMAAGLLGAVIKIAAYHGPFQRW
jgi:hypothetical protein